MKAYHYTATMIERNTPDSKLTMTKRDTALNKKALFDSLRELMKEGYTRIEIEVKQRENN